ncbi:Rrf2 family transcriptional regulator [Defluviimonas sp. 20V17]|uniref:Rrf2 family transcriptional regulator n=1 Tax=Allgaiera indica TaxID=765699 RepID=A0AAN4UW46_9RHOB|nr:Rrf2 family transcriptional regulator [Allgaiera indica]KDB04374.1 Rrf2 family transcriptional regulator [Defluviimonas sp. 20V17]GHE06057.1 Rrf2 family transcriptional regulator [Allgaiera indica]SDX84008.1 transcriptional regulator, BadM/Rrf2 family [Allgaiera indica]
MRLTMASDYALRVLLFAAAHGDRMVTIDEMLAAHDISRGHLMKVVRELATASLLRSQRGRGGGFTLGRPPEAIPLGEVVRVTEPDFQMVECFGPGSNCSIIPACRLPGVLNKALAAYMDVMDAHTLRDVLLRPEDFGVPQGAS